MEPSDSRTRPAPRGGEMRAGRSRAINLLGRKGDSEPGTRTLWLGIQRFDDIVVA